ncbi:MAG: GspE/PulE family protein, partial [Blastocatellia bacterium]
MAETSQTNGQTNGRSSGPPAVRPDSPLAIKGLEEADARGVAARYRLDYVDLGTAEIDYHVVHELPVDLMVRYNFVPIRREGNTLFVVMADPTNLEAIDEIEAQLRVRAKVAVGARSAIEEALKRGDTAARILQDATAGFRTDRLALVRETDHGEEDLDLDRLTGDEEMSPIIKLVDTVVLNALERRASDIHIETRDSDVVVKYRIDGALYRAADPIDIAHHQTIIQRIKVMSELDIAERRVPQDGRF